LHSFKQCRHKTHTAREPESEILRVSERDRDTKREMESVHRVGRTRASGSAAATGRPGSIASLGHANHAATCHSDCGSANPWSTRIQDLGDQEFDHAAVAEQLLADCAMHG
jgi:hypothetical protein